MALPISSLAVPLFILAVPNFKMAVPNLALRREDRDHRIHGNAFGDTEAAGEKTSSKHPAPRISTYGTWTFASGMPEGLFRCCFQCPANAGFGVFRGTLPPFDLIVLPFYWFTKRFLMVYKNSFAG